MKLTAGPCTNDGPRADVMSLERRPAKPPAVRFSADLHVRNPLQTPVWLFYGMRQLPSILTQALLWQTREKSPLFIWTLSGDHSAGALRIPMKADLVLHGVEITSFRPDAVLPLVFARDVRIADQAAPSWLGHGGMNPPQGEFHVEPRTLVIERELDELEGTPIFIDVLCVQQVDVQAVNVER
jgi:hypothetical protein